MARAQTVKKKGRSSSSAKSRTAGRRRRPKANAMAGSQGKGRMTQRAGRTGGSQDRLAGKGDSTGLGRAGARRRPQPRNDRPASATRHKPGSRGGGPVDRQAEGVETRRRRTRQGDGLELGREGPGETGRVSTRGAQPQGGADGRRARARRRTPRGDSESAGDDREHTVDNPSTP